MESHLSVAIVPRMVPVSAREASQAAADLGQALQDLNAAKAAGGATDVQRAEDAYQAAEASYKVEVRQAGVLARVNGTEIPISDYAVGSDEYGSPVVTLVLMPGNLSIGEPPATPPAAPIPAAKVSSWGDGSIPDPRESIPGWQPDRGERSANHAEQAYLRTWEPSGLQTRTSAFKRLIRLGGEGGSVAVTA